MRVPVILIVLLVPVTLSAAKPNPETLDLYLMDIRASGYVLAESVATYQAGELFLVDLEMFLEAVEFPIQRQDRIWSGWFYTQDNRFTWHMDRGEIHLDADETTTLHDKQWIESDEGIMVSLKALELWFDLELTPDTRHQTLTVVSSEPLPFQQRQVRTSSRNRYRSGQPVTVDVQVPDQYHWVTVPMFDLSVFQLLERNDAELSGSLTGSLAMGLDLLKHSVVYIGNAGLSSSSSENFNQRLTMTRAAATRDDTLFLGVNRYTLGDILSAKSNLVSSGGSGLGVSVERHSSSRGSSLNLVTISGDAPPGWEAEVYRNDTLLAFGSVDTDGRYIFPDQETVYGENIFVVRLFGPQGQVREDVHTYWGGGLELAEGDYNFSLSHIDFRERFIDDEPNSVSALSSDRTTDLRFEYAFTGDLQLGAGYTRAGLGSSPVDGVFQDGEYLSLLGRMNLGPGLLLAEAVQQRERGYAWSLEYLTTLYRHNISVARQTFNDFESPYTIRGSELDALNRVSLSGPLSSVGFNGYSLRLTHRDRADGQSDYRIFNRLGVRLNPMTLSNDLDYFRVLGGDDSYKGQLRLSSRRNRLSFGTQLDYDPTDRNLLNQVSATMRWNISRKMYNSFSVQKGLKNSHDIHVDNILSMRIGDISVSLIFNTSSSGDLAMGVGINSYFAYDRHSGGFITEQRSLANTGRATMNLFIDDNNNGVREPDELPVTRASYRGKGVVDTEKGGITLTTLPPYQPYHLETRHLRFDDLFLLPRSGVYELYTHPGSDISVDIAVVVTGDVEGYVRTAPGSDEAGVTGISGEVVALYDSNGNEVAVLRSEFDGYFSFVGIPVGEYEIRITPSSGKQKTYVQRFSLNSEEGYKMLDEIYIHQ